MLPAAGRGTPSTHVRQMGNEQATRNMPQRVPPQGNGINATVRTISFRWTSPPVPVTIRTPAGLRCFRRLSGFRYSRTNSCAPCTTATAARAVRCRWGSVRAALGPLLRGPFGRVGISARPAALAAERTVAAHRAAAGRVVAGRGRWSDGAVKESENFVKIDPAFFFSTMFGSEMFESYIGELQVSEYSKWYSIGYSIAPNERVCLRDGVAGGAVWCGLSIEGSAVSQPTLTGGHHSNGIQIE